MSNVSRGNYYLNKTIEFLEEEGYRVAKLERLNGLFIKDKKTGQSRMLWQKKDIWGSDCMAMNDKHLVFVQVKGGDMSLKKEAIVNFDNLIVPPNVEKWIVIWRPRVKVPEIITVK